MSGGSFNYLFHKEVSDLMEGQGIEDLKEMIEELEDNGFEDIAKDSITIYEDIQRIKLDLEKKLDRLSPVWRAVEYWRSADCSLDDVKKEVEKYRKVGLK